ncbi:MAG: TerB family tellurite resistance protein [Prevotellaceae bacterium]|jgi:DnaJ like chaperone protein|nr:TerB family tellurite resistance protein [Prevotellaceae bacterium]
MAKYGKWISGALGWWLLGPVGGIVGFALGSLFDAASSKSAAPPRPPEGGAPRDGFTVSLLVLMAAVLKADGKVMQSELDYVKKFLVQRFGAEAAKEALLFLRKILEQPLPLYEVCRQIRTNLNLSARLELLHLLFGIAAADGEISASERNITKRIAEHLGVSDADYESVSAMFATSDRRWAYKVLEVERTATDDEVKKAYRRMAVKHHPDKVAKMGEDVQRAAAEKFRKVQEAYERIKQERGMK